VRALRPRLSVVASALRGPRTTTAGTLATATLQ
jgi:hypothetical protein